MPNDHGGPDGVPLPIQLPSRGSGADDGLHPGYPGEHCLHLHPYKTSVQKLLQPVVGRARQLRLLVSPDHDVGVHEKTWC